jgi:hypothetical protein
VHLKSVDNEITANGSKPVFQEIRQYIRQQALETGNKQVSVSGSQTGNPEVGKSADGLAKQQQLM